MKVKDKKDSDGICFGKQFEECLVCVHKQKGCNTYECPFYKPCGCEDWVRLEHSNKIVLLPPEEYYIAGAE